ncbi:hypothetical protein MMA231_03715 (plasmid) [Asticcacaulis sp. MM231]
MGYTRWLLTKSPSQMNLGELPNSYQLVHQPLPSLGKYKAFASSTTSPMTTNEIPPLKALHVAAKSGRVDPGARR